MTTKQNFTVFNYALIMACSLLVVFGIYQIFKNQTEDGIVNLIIGTSLAGSNLNFDYNKAPIWQKILFAIYAMCVFGATAYILYIIFTK